MFSLIFLLIVILLNNELVLMKVYIAYLGALAMLLKQTCAKVLKAEGLNQACERYNIWGREEKKVVGE